MRLIRYTTPTTRHFAPALARSPWVGLEEQMNRLFEAALGDLNAVARPSGFPVDLYQDNSATYVRAELPGVNRDDINVELADDILRISAKRTRNGEGGTETTEFTRALTVPEGVVQTDKITAAYENGVLTVTLPKREDSKPRKINVTVA